MTETADYIEEGEDYAERGGETPFTGEDITGEEGELVIDIPSARYAEGKTATAKDADLVAGNIKDGVVIFGVEGTHAPLTGDDITGADGSLVIAIPAANYPAGKTATAQDADLVAGNIKDGVVIFGVEGTHAPLTGDDITGADGSLVIAIPAANYPAGKTATAQDADLVAGNIKAGVDIFGVVGTYVGSSGAGIESIQTGIIPLRNGVQCTKTIAAVDVSKSILLYNGHEFYSGSGLYTHPLIWIQDGTTVAGLSSGSTSTIGADAHFTVVEFSGGAGVQRGVATLPDGTVTLDVLIDTIDPAKSVAIWTGQSCDAICLEGSWCWASILDATHIRIHRRRDDREQKVGWEILEFD